MSTPSPQTFSILPEAQKIEILNTLFEPCPTLTSYLIPQLFSNNQVYNTYTQIIENSRAFLIQLKDEYLANPSKELKEAIDKIISAHPRLGPPKPTATTTIATTLSSHSKSEQASLNSGDPKLSAKLIELNDLYESTFPGLRFVVFVNGRSRDEIMEIMKRRISGGDLIGEIEEAFNAMCDIAVDRARKLGAKL